VIGKAPHDSIFTAQRLEASFIRVGFELVETGYHGKTKSTRFIAARRKRKKPPHSKMQRPLNTEK
jgi:hypothetical protein